MSIGVFILSWKVIMSNSCCFYLSFFPWHWVPVDYRNYFYSLLILVWLTTVQLDSNLQPSKNCLFPSNSNTVFLKLSFGTKLSFLVTVYSHRMPLDSCLLQYAEMKTIFEMYHESNLSLVVMYTYDLHLLNHNHSSCAY